MQNLIVTDAGLAALINAQHSGTTPIVITHLKLGSAQWRADASATNLKNVTKTFDVQYGGTVDAHTIQVAAIDQSEEQYVAYEMGIFTKDGTLFAIATSDSDPIIQKHASSINEILCRIVVRSANDGDLQVGDGNLTFLVPQASETAAGIAQFATLDEVIAGVETGKVIAPATLVKFLQDYLKKTNYRRLPPGTIVNIATKDIEAPEGFLFCDGSLVPVKDFPTLAALGWLSYDDSREHLILPDWDGRVGETTNNPQKVGTTIEDSLPTISGKFDASTQYARNDTDTKLFVKSFKETSICQLGPQANDGWTYTVFLFDATRVNAKFNGNKIQPAVYLHRTLIAY